MDNNLVSLNKLQTDIKAMKLISIFLKPEQRKQLKDMEKQLENMIVQTTAFNDRFSSQGWCAYDSMNFSLMESANAEFETNGLEAAEQILINYYKSDVSKIIYCTIYYNQPKWDTCIITFCKMVFKKTLY